jgi:prepilin-type N-terminal cleavage/methylation domain-containing protein
MRRGFTLVEVIVALSVTALVASLAYATVQAGLDTGERIRALRDGPDAEAAVRDLVSRALRHADHGGPGGGAVFVLVPGPLRAGPRLRFVTRGMETTPGASAAWVMSVGADRAGLLVEAFPMDEDRPPLRARLASVRDLVVQVAPAGPGFSWRSDWPTPEDAPALVSLTFVGHDGRPRGAPLVARVGLEALP